MWHDWHSRALRKLETLNEDGLNRVSYLAADSLLRELSYRDIKPDRIVRTADFLISMWFVLPSTSKIRVEACEDGEFVLSLLSRSSASTHMEFATAADVAKELATMRDADG